MASQVGRRSWGFVQRFRHLIAAVALSLFGLGLAPELAGPAFARPARIVSMNPCVDSVLLRVADPGQIAAISHWSHDPRGTSAPLAQARRFPAHGGTAEEVIAKRPDLVFVTSYTPLATRAALARLKVPMVSVGVPASIEESLAQLRAIADAAGQPTRGAALEAAIRRALAATKRASSKPALMRMASGFVPGPGSLSEALMAHAGLASMAGGYGLKGAGILPLEPLVMRAPTLLITDQPDAQHAIIGRLALRVEGFDRSLLNCGGPSLVPAAQRLAQIRDAAP